MADHAASSGPGPGTSRTHADASHGNEPASRALFDDLPYGAVVSGPEFQLQRVNRAFCRLLGCDPEDLIGRSFADVTHPDDLASSQELLARLTRGEIDHFIIEKRYVTRSGGTVHAMTFVRGRYAPAGDFVGSTATIVDITERVRAEAALRESEGRYRMLFEGANDAIFLMEDGRFADCNARTLQVFGCTRDEIVGHHPADFSPPRQRDGSASAPRAEARMSAALAGEPQSFEWLHCRKDGTPFDAEVSLVRAEWQGRVYLQAIVRDVTERRRGDEALRESERRLSTVLETMSLIGVMLDTQGRITFCNDFLLDLTGWAREEVLGQSWFERFLPPEIREEIRNGVFLSTIQRGEVPVHLENEIVTRLGERRLVAWNNTILRDPDGRITGTASVGVDVTERRHAEEARLELERRLLHAQKLESLGVLAGGIAHDFNNLLMAILGNLELGLRDLPPASPVRSRIESAGQAARRAADLTRQMLAYSGRGKFLVGRVDLNQLVEENVHLLRTSIPRTVTLDLHLDRSLPEVEADDGQIQQVVMNLITNAAEAVGGEPGLVTLSTGVRDCDGSYLGRSRLDEIPAAGRYAYLEVTDSGCGMDEETQKRMFDPFFTTKFTGRGLGLPAVFGIVRGHGGALLIDSTVGKGTTIRVLFPAAEATPVEAVPARPAPAGVAEAVTPGTEKGTILIVDDEEMVLRPCAAMLESMGFTVLTAGDGEQAVEVVRRHGTGIRAIILDLTMPKLDGAGALERILRIEPGAKVILSSGYDEGEATGRVAKGRLAGFIRKPYQLEELRGTLEQVLGTAL
jgi:PAS domain S-box-containing protein